MAVPAPTLFYDNLTVPALVPVGGPDIVDDQHNPLSAYDLDGNNDRVYASTDKPYAASVNQDWSMSCWVYRNGVGAVAPILGNRLTTSTGTTSFNLYIESGNRLVILFRNGTTGHARDSIVNQNILADGWYWVFAKRESGSLSLQIDDSFISYFRQDNDTGTPPTDWVSPSTLGMGSFFNDSWSSGFDGIIARPKFWDGTALSTAQIGEEYANEVAAIGEGFGVSGAIVPPHVNSLIDPMTGPLTS